MKYRGKSIYDVLEMTVDDAIAFFGENKKDPTCKRIVEMSSYAVRMTVSSWAPARTMSPGH